MRGPAIETGKRQRGFALLIVLWTLVLIAFVVAHLTTAGRVEIRIAGNLAANAAAQAAADGAIYQVLFDLADRQARKWPLDGAPRDLRIGQSRVTLRLSNEAAKLNPNLASPALVEALLRVLGNDQDRAARLAAAIAQWVGKPIRITPELDLPVSLAYQPPRAPAESINELSNVHGMTPATLASMRPHLTLFGPAEPDPVAADPAIQAALALIASRTTQTNPIVPSASPAVTVRIAATAQGPGGALVSRVAVARVDPSRSIGFVMLAWDNGDD